MVSTKYKSSDEFNEEPSYTNDKHYAVTIRHNPKYKKGTKVPYTKDEKMSIYSQVLTHICNEYKGKIVFVQYEKKNGIHIHGTIAFQKIPFFKMIKFPDIHFKWRKVYSAGWITYCHKEIRNEQKKIEEYYSKNYGFVNK